MTMSRRQNSSCDQCRKGKRACDAVWLRDNHIQRTLEANGLKGSPGLSSQGGSDDEFDLVGPCTNCARTNKHCTFEWVQSQQVQRKERLATGSASNTPSSRKGGGGSGLEALPSGSQSPTSPSNIPLRPLQPTMPTTTTTFDGPAPYIFSAHDQQMLMNSCSYPATDPAEGYKMMPTSSPVAGVAFVDGSLTTTPSTTPMGMPGTSCLSMDTIAATAQPTGSSAYMDVNVLGPYGLGPFCTGATPASCYADAPLAAGSVSGLWSPSVSAPLHSHGHESYHQHGMQHMRKRRRTQSPGARANSGNQTTMTTMTTTITPPPLWDMLGGHRLARSANGTLIGETMMRIYHDVMEGALSCWLVEQTCPYNSLVPASTPSSSSASSTGMSGSSSSAAAAAAAGGGPHNHNPQQQFWGAFEEMQRDWGGSGGAAAAANATTNWSNRIYRRVITLDRRAHLLGLKRLAPADERKVSAALNAAVMAFTAQWAQASQRSAARWPPGGDNDDDENNDEHEFRPPELGEEFDRTLQKSFWNQARMKLNDCSEIDSFRVVFAEIIFGLTQKYRENVKSGGSGGGGRGGTGGRGGGMGRAEGHVGGDLDAATEAVEDLLREDTQQLWLERAIRRLHVLRRRVELYDRHLHNQRDSEHSAYDAECRKTIDLLLWLTVMVDTISAAMTERPLTVSDEDSSNLDLTHSTIHTPMLGHPSKRWHVILAKDQQTKASPLRWPCTDAEISRELTDAAPVKVLLYRKVTLLQTLIARATDARVLEEAISDTLMVYAHWQAIYGAIFADCIAHHALLSPRIQSWYVCLFGHWLLAMLIIAELMDTIDGRGLGGELEAWRRAQEGTVAAIRRDTLRLISDLAKASTPQHDEVTRTGEVYIFHPAVSEAALLTEPWTIILLRTFSKAAILFLEEAEDPTETRSEAPEESTRRLERCEDCIKALWYLGRKSDMAREVSDVLSVALQRARRKLDMGNDGYVHD